jgi:2-amino-4-hydroxy-6-hydroxymethyldihydropteridine diphosphokinase
VEKTLTAALRHLALALGPLEIAPLYRTAPVSPLPQPDYLNTAAVGRTALPPDAVLSLAKVLERSAGRRSGARTAPRPLDIDLLLYDDLVTGSPELTLPHPELLRRRFALAPLADLAPECWIPPDGPTVAEALATCPHRQAVERVAWSAGGLP